MNVEEQSNLNVETHLVDVDSLKPADDVTHDVVVAYDGEGKAAAGFKIVGENSSQYQAIKRDLTVTLVQRSAQRNKQIDSKTVEGATQVVDATEANKLKVALACTVGWFGFAKGKEPLEFSREALKDVLAKRPAWRDKIAAGVETEANFFAK